MSQVPGLRLDQGKKKKRSDVLQMTADGCSVLQAQQTTGLQTQHLKLWQARVQSRPGAAAGAGSS
jgi:hypothetical protein